MGYSFLYAFIGEREEPCSPICPQLGTLRTQNKNAKKSIEGVKRRPLSERVSQTGFSFRWEIAEFPWDQWPVASVHKSRIRKA